MRNNPNNPFRCTFKRKVENKIIIIKRMELQLDSSVLVKRQNGEVISLNDLQEKDRLEIIFSPTSPNQVIEIEVLPPVIEVPSPVI